MMPLRGLLLAGLLLPLVGPGPVGAQRVVGRVVDAGSGVPVATAFVVLLDEAGQRRAAVLTRADGAFALEAPEHGVYRIRVDRIGYRSVTTAWFAVTSEPREPLIIGVAEEAIRLDPISVEGAGRCVLRPEEGQETHALWAESRKALEITEWVGAESRFVYHVLVFRRYQTTPAMVVDTEWVEALRIDGDQPFIADSTADLIRLGFIQGDAEDRTFHGPDARLLLSDAFLDTHCFRRFDGEEPGLIGLAFEPIDRKARADIEGVLWLDGATRELRRLEFRYVNPRLPVRVSTDRYGGSVHFHRMDDGSWIISRWRIMSPVMLRYGRRVRLEGFSQTEGEVFAVRTTGGEAVPWTRTGGALTGLVARRRGGRPAEGARVRIMGTPYETTTDANGWFGILGLPEGRYRVEIDGDGLRRMEKTVTIVRGDTVHLSLSG